MQAFKYKIYRTKRTKHIDDMLREAAFTWNKALAMQKRYYALFGKYINKYRLQKWFDKRYKRHYLGSQVRQEIIDRLDAAYNRFFKKLAHELCKKYDYIFIEDLCLTGMTKMWGRKMNDLAHTAFIDKLEYVASKYGVVVHKIDRWYASSKTCECGYVNKSLQLSDREWICPKCGSINHRDLLAANNILRKGISELESMCKTSSEASYACIQESYSL